MPVLTFGKHDDSTFYDNSYSYQSHDEDYEEVAGHYIFLVYCQGCFDLLLYYITVYLFIGLLTIIRTYLIKYGGLVEVCKSLSFVAMYSSIRD